MPGMNSPRIRHEHVVEEKDAGLRLDHFLTRRHADMSRSQLQKLVEDEWVLVNGVSTKTSHKLKAGDTVSVQIPEPQPSAILPEPMNLNILYEDGDLLVLNKPAGLVVHPAVGHYHGTLVNGLLHHCRDLSGIGGILRPGIVHRLDKDTSGLMVIAKTDPVHRALSGQFMERRVKKNYQALVYGNMAEERGLVDLPIGRHPVERQMMSTRSRRGKEAVTRWEVRERFGVATFLDILIETGRTHQIRVHLNAIGHPVIGDPVYGKARGLENSRNQRLREQLKKMHRQALHAGGLSFFHPVRCVALSFSSPLAEDMADLCAFLRNEGGD